MKTRLLLLVALLVGATAFAAPTVTSGVIGLTRGLLLLPDGGARSLGPGTFLALGYPFPGDGALRAGWAVRAEGALFEGTVWSASMRGELGATLRLTSGLFTEAAAGLGYMHTWQSEVYVPAKVGGYGPGIDYAGSASLCAAARLGLGWRAGQGPFDASVLLSYEVVFAVAPWFMWNNTLMSGWSLSVSLSDRKGN